ncbi:MAG: ribulose-phosphate 3-epimerase [Candidatus Omnitrophota bacterium]|nr:ribulose-phosphate 3-epimerase [Candidatus Omnitrophota bacterium]
MRKPEIQSEALNTAVTQKTLIAPSILSADFSRLGEEIEDIEKGGCDIIHIDVMDGRFVPNLTLGPPVIKHFRKVSKLPFDVHLMIDEPINSVADYRKAGADWITIHVEAASDVSATLTAIGDLGAKRGISLRPMTPLSAVEPYLDQVDLVLIMTVEPGFGGQSFMPEMLKKIRTLRPKFTGLISVDGGINVETGRASLEAGADILVAGTSVFGQEDRAQAIASLRRAAGK